MADAPREECTHYYYYAETVGSQNNVLLDLA
jgi:hypothetical protein